MEESESRVVTALSLQFIRIKQIKVAAKSFLSTLVWRKARSSEVILDEDEQQSEIVITAA